MQTESPNADDNPKKKPKTTKAAPKRPPEWTFPRQPLEEAIQVAQAIEDKNGGNPMEAAMVAKAVGFNRGDDWRFLQLLHSANLYGLVSGSGAKATVALEPIGADVVAPDSPSQRQKALLRAFRNVPDFREVADYYRGKRIPEDEFFSNTLTRRFNVPKDRVSQFIDVFTKDLTYLKGFDVPTSDDDSTNTTTPDEIAPPTDRPAVVEGPARVRQFLDTCFVMMPYGKWFNRYYKDIDAPAIRDAGFEPVRADELFSTGTVIEQIWHQVMKSKVLLADLSGKNANVFYELGLSHAACKPVILTARDVRDIPFDLRHLRAIIYNVKAPDWASVLGTHITAYLKNARSEPDKSIPQPFRDHMKSDGNRDESSPADDGREQ